VLKRTVKVLEGDAGGPIGKVVYFRDITLEDEVDRMKSEFLSTAAHELRTPMSSILGFTELLLKRDYDPATRRELLETIHRQSTNLGKLINELLDLARIEARAGKDFRVEPRSLFPLVRETVSGLIVPGDGRKVEVTLPARSPRVAVDADKFRQALLNVLSNAYKYSPGGGAIEVHARTRKHDAVRQVGIVVRDQGIGMTPDQCDRIFERFYRADTTGAVPGTGLGMSVVKEIVELHGGAVEVESAHGVGTAVTLWLPLDDGNRARPGKREGA
jgi:signal transduction histidine kinase